MASGHPPSPPPAYSSPPPGFKDFQPPPPGQPGTAYVVYPPASGAAQPYPPYPAQPQPYVQTTTTRTTYTTQPQQNVVIVRTEAGPVPPGTCPRCRTVRAGRDKKKSRASFLREQIRAVPENLKHLLAENRLTVQQHTSHVGLSAILGFVGTQIEIWPTMCGVCWAIWCFPFGFICCVAMRETRCTHCGALFV